MSDPKTTPPITLPPARYHGTISLEETLKKRRSIRKYADSSISKEQVSQLLWAAQGISHLSGYRTTPSAGALYPLETYLAAGKVEGLESGVYVYRPQNNTLDLTAAGDKRDALCRSALNQSSVRNAPLSIVFCAVPERITGKYGERGIRYIYMELGHAAQNVCLQAIALGLGTVVIGAFHETAAAEAISCTQSEHPLYIVCIGTPR